MYVSFREKRWFRCFWGPSFGHFDWRLLHWCDQRRRGPYLSPTKKSRRGFSQVSQQRSPMVSRSTKHDRVTIPEGEISLANSGTTTANPPKSQTLSKEKCPFQAEKGVGVILSSQKNINQLQSSSNYPNSWKSMVKRCKKQKNLWFPKKVEKYGGNSLKTNLGIPKVHHGTTFFLLQKTNPLTRSELRRHAAHGLTYIGLGSPLSGRWQLWVALWFVSTKNKGVWGRISSVFF